MGYNEPVVNAASNAASNAVVASRFGLSADSPLLEEALTHPSFSNERREGSDYQRLEFLGDAILQMCVSEALWQRFPSADEGELSRRRAQIVNAQALATFAQECGIADALRLGRGAEAGGLRASVNVLSDALEALLAASYLEAGPVQSRAVCEALVESVLSRESLDLVEDPKTRLQERVQGAGRATPTYQLMETWGPPHERWFRVNVLVGTETLAEGVGKSKRAAERAAAEAALGGLAPVAEGGPE